MIAPGLRSRLGQPSSRLPIPGATELSTVEWQMAHVMPTDLSCRPRTVPTNPTTALSLINSTVMAGSFKSRVDRKFAGTAVASTFSPTPSAVTGLTDDWMASCIRNVSVHNCSSPKVSKRNICRPWFTCVFAVVVDRTATAESSIINPMRILDFKLVPLCSTIEPFSWEPHVLTLTLGAKGKFVFVG